MFNFIHSPIAWAFALVAVPLLIHLINMMRHKRVKWAAMEFLLASYKKHRKWIWLKQLILLLMRMAAIAAVVTIMAQWVPPDRWAKLFGGKVTHHYVLLDDSFSMSDRNAGETAFSRAKDVVGNLIERAGAEEIQQKITLIRYSQAAQAGRGANAGLVADVSDQPLADRKWRPSFKANLAGMEVSQFSGNAEPALALLDGLLKQESDQSRVVYLISDFRNRDWENPTGIDARLSAWEQAGAEINLVDCVESQQPNLAVTYLAPTEGTRSAGVPLFVTMTVKNFGPETATDVELTVTSYSYEEFNRTRHGDDPAEIKPQALDRRSETIKSLAAGESASRRVQVRFPVPGKHVVEAKLPEDAVDVDNLRYCVVDLPEGEPVLIVDGHDEDRHAFYLTSVFRPRSAIVDADGRSGALTGIVPTVKQPEYLNNVTLDELQRTYRAVYLLDVPRLDEVAREKLESYVAAGGGLAIFLGENVNPTYYREQFYAEGEGLMPMPLDKLELLTLGDVDDEQRVPDFEAVEHPILEVFNHRETGALFRRGVMIGTYYLTAPGWSPSAGETTEVLATLRDKAKTPLVAEKKFGQGRVIAWNTTAAPLWNNWKGEASFPATMLLLHGYIAAPLRTDQSRLVGTSVNTNWDPEVYQEDARFIVPAVSPTSRKPVATKARVTKAENSDGTAAEGEVLSLALGLQRLYPSNSAATDQQGIYEIWAAKKLGELEVDRFAFNVDPEEGDLDRLSGSDLTGKLEAGVAYHRAGEMRHEAGGESKSHISEILLYILIALLVCEQLMAYWASYHPSASGARGGHSQLQASTARGAAR